MSYVQPRDLRRANAPMVHAANVVYVLNEIRVRRGDLAAAGVLWGRVVRVGGVVSVGSARVLEVGVLVGGPSGPGAFRNVKAWNEAADVFAPMLRWDFYGLLVGEWRAAVGKDGRLRQWLDLWAVYGPSDDPKRLGRPLPAPARAARRYRPWWRGQGNAPHAWYGWLRVGWRVETVDLAAETVTLARPEDTG